MTKELAFETWLATLPKPVQENIRDGVKHGESYTKQAFMAGWAARVADEPDPPPRPTYRVGRNTVIIALEAMKAQAKAGAYRQLMPDDASYIREALEELTRAAKNRGDEHG